MAHLWWTSTWWDAGTPGAHPSPWQSVMGWVVTAWLKDSLVLIPPAPAPAQDLPQRPVPPHAGTTQ